MTAKSRPYAVPKLTSISYSEFEEDLERAWHVENFEPIDINLIVGLNATGKSRVLRVLYGLARSIDGTRSPTSLDTGHYKAVFHTADSTEITYEFSIYQKKVKLERLSVDGKARLNRSETGKGNLYFNKNSQDIEVQIPPTLLAVPSRRDEDQHPFFEPLHAWAQTIKYFEFSKVGGQIYSAFEGNPDMSDLPPMPLQENLHLIIKLAKDRFGHSFTSAVITDMRRLGYHLESFSLKPAVGVQIPIAMSGTPLTLFIKERDIGAEIAQAGISNGMLRALACLIILHSSRLQKARHCILLDDIGEGLDFERATKLIEILYEEASKGYLQLVMTSNDRFVMNALPIEYWSIIHRDKGTVKVINNKNSSDVFAEFEKWGFNNFDFFAKRLYLRDSNK